MSSCRCSDISNTEEKIRKLGNAKTILARYGSKHDALNSELTTCASEAELATESNKVASYRGTMTSLGSEMQQAANGISGKMDRKLGELNSSLNQMRHEDHEYHEEERRKAEEAAKEAARKQAEEAAIHAAGNWTRK